jgi:hypothetical protein
MSPGALEPGSKMQFTDTRGVVVSEKAEVTQNYNYAPQSPVKQVFPTLLKYMMDRSEQELLLQDALNDYDQRAPLVVLVHGDEFQCHDKFIELMQRVSLPRMLRLDAEQQTIKSYQIDIPTSLSLDRQPQWMLKKLSEEVLRHSSGSREEIITRLARYNAPVLLHTHFLSEHWKQYGANLIECYLRFWQQWQWDYEQGMLLFVCIKYQAAYNKRGLWGFSKPTVNEQMQTYLESLDMAHVPPLEGLVLPRLGEVPQDEAEDWARRQEVKDLCDTEKLIKAIRGLYQKYQNGISLETLVVQLEPTINASMIS